MITTTTQSILTRLTNAVNGTDEELYTLSDRLIFALFYIDKWDENTSDDVIAESFVDFWWNTDRQCRRCSECGNLMREGYCINGGEDYYCSDECLHFHFSVNEWKHEFETNDQSCYTEWY